MAICSSRHFHTSAPRTSLSHAAVTDRGSTGNLAIAASLSITQSYEILRIWRLIRRVNDFVDISDDDAPEQRRVHSSLVAGGPGAVALGSKPSGSPYCA